MAEPELLSTFPRPNVAVDLAVLSVARVDAKGSERSLCVVVQRGADSRPMLPGMFIREGRTVEQTVAAVLRTKLELEPPSAMELRLLRVFDAPGRDPRSWTLSIGYSLGVPEPDAEALQGELVAVDQDGGLVTGESLMYDHDDILREAVTRMRRRYERGPDPDGLLPPPFTLSQLRRLHEIVLGEPLRKDTFNRRMKDLLDQARDRAGSPVIASLSVGRPAQMFTFSREVAPSMPQAVPYPLPRTDDPHGGRRGPSSTD